MPPLISLCINDQIGKGGCADVVAVKRLIPAADTNADYEREVDWLSLPSHPSGECIIVKEFMPLDDYERVLSLPSHPSIINVIGSYAQTDRDHIIVKEFMPFDAKPHGGGEDGAAGGGAGGGGGGAGGGGAGEEFDMIATEQDATGRITLPIGIERHITFPTLMLSRLPSRRGRVEIFSNILGRDDIWLKVRRRSNGRIISRQESGTQLTLQYGIVEGSKLKFVSVAADCFRLEVDDDDSDDGSDDGSDDDSDDDSDDGSDDDSDDGSDDDSESEEDVDDDDKEDDDDDDEVLTASDSYDEDNEEASDEDLMEE